MKSKKQAHRVGAYLPEIELPGVGMNKISEGIFVLSGRSARLFGADCTEHVLPIWEKLYPDDLRPRRAVEAARRAASSNSTKTANIISSENEPMIEAGMRADEVSTDMSRGYYGTGAVPRSAARACSVPTALFWSYASPRWEMFSAQAAMMAAQEAWAYSIGLHLGNLPDDNLEGDWQYAKLKEYLQLDAQDAMMRDEAQGIMPLEGERKYIAFGTLVRRQTLSMLALLQNQKLNEKHSRLVMDCLNEISERDKAEFWAISRTRGTKLTALEVLIEDAGIMNPGRILKDWGPFKPAPKRPKKEKISGVESAIKNHKEKETVMRHLPPLYQEPTPNPKSRRGNIAGSSDMDSIQIGDARIPRNVQETIDRAYAYWTGSSSVGVIGAKSSYRTKAQKAERLAYLATLSQIKDYKRKTPTTVSALGILRDWQNDKALTRLVQEVTGETPGYYNIIQLAEEATPEEYDHWIHWYQHAHDDVVALRTKHNRIRQKKGKSPYPFNVIAAVVAVLSPNNSWINNLAAADYLLTHDTGEGSTAYRANAAKALSMMNSWLIDQVRGPKVTVFYESLHKPWKMGGHVVLDGHMLNIWRGHKRGIKNTKQPNEAEREQILRDFRQAAEDLGITPQSVQALTWYIWRYTTDKPSPYAKAIKAARTVFMADLRARKQAEEEADRMAEEYLREEEMFWWREEDSVEGVGSARTAKSQLPSEMARSRAPKTPSAPGLMLPSGTRLPDVVKGVSLPMTTKVEGLAEKLASKIFRSKKDTPPNPTRTSRVTHDYGASWDQAQPKIRVTPHHRESYTPPPQSSSSHKGWGEGPKTQRNPAHVNAERLLGLSEPYTPEDVKRAFKRAAFSVHPDRGGSHSEFVELKEAANLLLRRKGERVMGLKSSSQKKTSSIGAKSRTVKSTSLAKADAAVKAFAAKHWPKGFLLSGWGSDHLPKGAVPVRVNRSLECAYLFLVKNKHSLDFDVWATPFDTSSGFLIGNVLNGKMVLNEYGEQFI